MKEVHGEGYAPPWRRRWTPRLTCVGYANPVGPAHKKSLPAGPTTQTVETCLQKRAWHRGGAAGAQCPNRREAGDAAGHEPQPVTSLPGLGGRKTIQDAWHTVDLGRPAAGRLASAQRRAAIRTPGLQGRPAHGGGAVSVSPLLPGGGPASRPGQGTPPVRRRLYLAHLSASAPPSRGANVAFAQTNRGSGPRGF